MPATNDQHQLEMIKNEGRKYILFSVALEIKAFSARHYVWDW